MENDKTSGQESKEALVPGSKEYEAAMIARFEQGEKAGEEKRDVITAGDGQPKVPPMPQGGSDKFYNKETGAYDWASHAKELQFKLDQQKKPDENKDEKPKDQQQQQDGEKKPGEGAEVQNVVERAGLKMENLRDQILSNEKLDDASRAALIKSGIPEVLIDEYVESVVYRVKANTNRAIDYAGGAETWDAISAWAATNLDPAEKAKYNGMLKSVNEADWKVALDTLKTKMKAHVPGGRESGLITGTRPSNGGVSGYRSKAEQTKAMQDPRYKTDASYRASVMNKVAVSNYEDDQVRR